MAHNRLGLERIVFFSDAVFAIAMTLLVTNLKPPTASDLSAQRSLLPFLVSHLANYQAYVISFMVLGLYWVGHHHYFRYLKRYDPILIGLNMGLLMCITFLPFPTEILEDYGNQRLSVFFYAASMAVTGFVKSLLWWYASDQHRLIHSRIRPQRIRTMTYVALVPPVVFLGSILIIPFSPEIAEWSWILIIGLLLLPKWRLFTISHS
ncbi:MAG: TMEM175 family protein [Thermosynechococcaceae cyanobacterium]